VNMAVLGNPTVLFAILISSILGTGLAIMVQTMAQTLLNPTRVALVFTLEPVFASLTAFLVLKEQLPAAAGLGAVMVLAGILMAELPSFPLLTWRTLEEQLKLG